MDDRATGIILRTRPLTETSLIVHWLTREQGRVATVAKGARRPKSPFRGKLDLFYLGDFSYARSRRSDLHTLREVVLRETHSGLRRELASLQQASYATAFIEQTTETESPVPELFDLCGNFLRHLNQSTPRSLSIFAFEMKILRELGLEPDIYDSKHSEGSRTLLRKLTDEDWPVVSQLAASDSQLREVQHFLHGFLVYHLGKTPAGRSEAVG